jgi:hypothetical protein
MRSPRKSNHRELATGLRSEPLWLPGGTTISTISRRRLVHNAGYPAPTGPLANRFPT